MAVPLYGTTAVPDDHFSYTALLADTVDDSDGVGFGDAAGVGMGVGVGSFLRLHLDATVLAAYESPSFDEANAVPLDALTMSQSPAGTRPTKRAKSKASASADKTEPVKAENGSVDKDPNVRWMVNAQCSPSGESRCRYRKGKCDNLRTLKKNGSLHSYCELHRQRSVVNQRRFDTKKREARSMCRCGGSTKTSYASEVATPPPTTTTSQRASGEPQAGPSDDATPPEPASAGRIHEHKPQFIEDDAAWV